MDWITLVNKIVVVVGIPAILGGCVVVGRKFQILDDLKINVGKILSEISDLTRRLTTLEVKVGMIETDLSVIKPDLKDVRERFFAMEGRKTFAPGSPIKLTDVGTKILNESGIKEYIDSKPPELSGACSKSTTAYDIQQEIFSFFTDLKLPDEIETKLKEAAFQAGLSLDVIKRVGAIYFRDICLGEHGFKPEDLDTPKP